MGQWVHIPDGSTILVTPSPARLYPAAGGPDELTEVLDEWESTHTASCKVINLLEDGVDG